MMVKEKDFLTYDQQMELLGTDKKISCNGSEDMKILRRTGYFNLIGGYKTPFINGTDVLGKHTYLPGTGIQNLYALKLFDDELRSLTLKYITKAEEEIRAFASYKFDEVNNNGQTRWYEVSAYKPYHDIKDTVQLVELISKEYNEISRSKLNYVKVYMDSHNAIPTWIVTKAISFSTFIDFIEYSKDSVKTALCELYGIKDDSGCPNFSLLITSLHWMRKIRNVCAHNERVYTVSRENGRVKQGSCTYLSMLPKSYSRERDQKLMDLCIYLKYYLDGADYRSLILQVESILFNLKKKVSLNAFEKIRADMGIKDIKDLDLLLNNSKTIEYNKF